MNTTLASSADGNSVFAAVPGGSPESLIYRLTQTSVRWTATSAPSADEATTNQLTLGAVVKLQLAPESLEV